MSDPRPFDCFPLLTELCCRNRGSPNPLNKSYLKNLCEWFPLNSVLLHFCYFSLFWHFLVGFSYAKNVIKLRFFCIVLVKSYFWLCVCKRYYLPWGKVFCYVYLVNPNFLNNGMKGKLKFIMTFYCYRFNPYWISVIETVNRLNFESLSYIINPELGKRFHKQCVCRS